MTDAEKTERPKPKGGKWANWCRMKGHPSTCTCTYEAGAALAVRVKRVKQ